jgi:hypothetical protein
MTFQAAMNDQQLVVEEELNEEELERAVVDGQKLVAERDTKYKALFADHQMIKTLVSKLREENRKLREENKKRTLVRGIAARAVFRSQGCCA